MTLPEIFAKKLSAHRYGLGYNEILKILQKLSDWEVKSLAYQCYRTSEKCGHDGFSLELED